MDEEKVGKLIANLENRNGTREISREEFPVEKERILEEEIAEDKEEMEERIMPVALTEGEELEEMLVNNGVDKEGREEFNDKADEIKDRVAKAKKKYSDKVKELSSNKDGNEGNKTAESRIEDKQNHLEEITKEIEFVNSSRNMSQSDKDERTKELREKYEKIKNSHDVHTRIDGILNKKNVEEALSDTENKFQDNAEKSQE